jgi:hypothetical protein
VRVVACAAGSRQFLLFRLALYRAGWSSRHLLRKRPQLPRSALSRRMNSAGRASAVGKCTFAILINDSAQMAMTWGFQPAWI